MQMMMFGLDLLRRTARSFGPYLLVEIVLPGGTLFALMLFVYRRLKSGRG